MEIFSKKRVLWVLVLPTLIMGYFAWSDFEARAQQNVPFPWISWKTQTYVPAGFTGKILPTANSLIEASLEVVDGSKAANLRQNTIYWYANSQKIGGGVGADKISFRAPKAYGVLSLRAVVQDYRTGALSHTTQIPITKPVAVIDSSYPNDEFFENQIFLKAVPYFFNSKGAGSFSFDWRVNGTAPDSREAPDKLVVNVNPDALTGSTLNVSLSIKNAANASEQASAIKKLTFVK